METTVALPRHSVVAPVLAGATLCHLLNDSMQAVVPALFPLLHESLGLSFTQLGVIAFANNLVASVIQPLIGTYTDRRALAWLLPTSMLFTMGGMVALAFSAHFFTLVLAVALVGLGSAVFHPETSRIVVRAGRGRTGTAQSVFQLGGNLGQALAPLFTLWIFQPYGQRGAMVFAGVAALGGLILYQLARWQREQLRRPKTAVLGAVSVGAAFRQRALWGVFLILVLTFARTWYWAGVTNFYALFRMETFGDSMGQAQGYLFTFMLSAALGTLAGGPVAERFGLKNTLAGAALLCAPLAMALPYATGFWTYVLLGLTGFTLISTFSITLAYTLLLLPGQVGKVSGLIYGLAFGLGAVGSLALGRLSDWVGVGEMMQWCSLIPLGALVAWLLPHEEEVRGWYVRA